MISCNCLRCGHSWFIRVLNPKRCPRCKSFVWWKVKKVEEYKGIKTKKYPIYDLEVGQSVTLPWQSDRHGRPDTKANYLITRAIKHEEKLKGKKFERVFKGAGVLIIRRQ